MPHKEQEKYHSSSRLPIPTNRHITTTVTLSKLDDKKNNNNNNKSRLFSTTCSRMAQEAKNYNKRSIKINKNLSSFYLPTPPPPKLQKMNTNKKSNIATATIKSKTSTIIPIAKSNTTAKKVQPSTLRKSPITQLKEDLERLRQKNQDDQSLIKKQTEEIMNLKKKLQTTSELKKKQKELESQLPEKSRIENQLVSVAVEKKNLSVEVVDLLEVKKTNNDSHLIYQDEIMKLQTQLETQDQNFKNKLEQHTTLLNEMDKRIQKQQTLSNKLKSDHANQIAQLNSIHMDRIHKLQIEHEQDMFKTRQEYNQLKKTCTKEVPQQLDDVIEQALLEFEQEQHNHAPTMMFQQQDSNERSIHGKMMMTMKNQQWYSKNYMPVDALSWPAPQSLSNLKRLQHQNR